LLLAENLREMRSFLLLLKEEYPSEAQGEVVGTLNYFFLIFNHRFNRGSGL
jgi:hypothetical protein